MNTLWYASNGGCLKYSCLNIYNEVNSKVCLHVIHQEVISTTDT